MALDTAPDARLRSFTTAMRSRPHAPVRPPHESIAVFTSTAATSRAAMTFWSSPMHVTALDVTHLFAAPATAVPRLTTSNTVVLMLEMQSSLGATVSRSPYPIDMADTLMV